MDKELIENTRIRVATNPSNDGWRDATEAERKEWLRDGVIQGHSVVRLAAGRGLLVRDDC